MRVVYATGARIAGGGIGNTSFHAAYGLFRHRMLERLICGSSRTVDIPRVKIRALGISSRILRKLAVFDKSNRLDFTYRNFFDLWAARQLTDCEVFHGWSGYCLNTLKAAKSIGAITILDRALAHPTYVDKWLSEEYARWGIPYQPALTSQRVRDEIQLADFVLIPSDFVRHTFQAEDELTDKLVQIPFGVDPQQFQPAPESVSARPFRALFMGQVSIRKGAHFLLEAWRLLGWQDAELWLVGQNKLDAHLRNRYRELKGVHFLGHVSDPVNIFQQADVFVFPSLLEGSALVTYEALACGLPVITTRNAGSLITNGLEGFLIPVRDPDAVAARLDQLRREDKLREKMGAAARTLAEANTWEQYGDRIAQNVRDII